MRNQSERSGRDGNGFNIPSFAVFGAGGSDSNAFASGSVSIALLKGRSRIKRLNSVAAQGLRKRKKRFSPSTGIVLLCSPFCRTGVAPERPQGPSGAGAISTM